jgi:hypothetical protein
VVEDGADFAVGGGAGFSEYGGAGFWAWPAAGDTINVSTIPTAIHLQL